MTNSHFLSNIFSPKHFSGEEAQTIIGKFKQVNYAKNEFLLRDGKTADHYWFIESGFVRSYVTDTEGNDISTNFYTAGDIVIDWTSFFLRNPSRENMQALTDCSCWQLDFTTFQELFHSIQPFREQGRTTLVNSYFSLKTKTVSMIADQAKERYIRLVKEKPYIVQNIPLKYIATFLGITDTSLSRIRKEIAGE